MATKVSQGHSQPLGGVIATQALRQGPGPGVEKGATLRAGNKTKTGQQVPSYRRNEPLTEPGVTGRSPEAFDCLGSMGGNHVTGL